MQSSTVGSLNRFIIIIIIIIIVNKMFIFHFFFKLESGQNRVSKSNVPQNCFDSTINLADTSLAKYSMDDVYINYISRRSTVEIKIPCLSLLI